MLYYENRGSVYETYRSLQPFCDRHNRPSKQIIRRTMDRFRTTFTLLDVPYSVRRKRVRTEENIAAVEQSFEEDPNILIRHRAQQMNVSPFTFSKILSKDLGLKPYKVMLVCVVYLANGLKIKCKLTNCFISKFCSGDWAYFCLNDK